MKLTTTWMAANFAKFNRKYFNAGLPTPRFIIVDSEVFLGQCGAKNWRSMNPDFYLKLSCHTERSEYQYQCTLLHEMIHLYWQSKGEWKVRHGDKFVEMALRFRKLGWNVSTGPKNDKRKQEVKRPIKHDETLGEKKAEDKYAMYAQASVRWEQIWCTRTDSCLTIHCKMQINGMKDFACDIVLSFCPANDISDKSLYEEFTHNRIPALFQVKKTLTPDSESAVWHDLQFEIPFYRLLQVDNSLMSKISFYGESIYYVNLHIIHNEKQFPCVAIYMLKVSASRNLFRKLEYCLESAGKDCPVNVPLHTNGACNDPGYLTGMEKKEETIYKYSICSSGYARIYSTYWKSIVAHIY